MSDTSPTVTLFGGFSNFTFSTLKCLVGKSLNLTRLVISAYGPNHGESERASDKLFQSKNPGIVEFSQQHGIPIIYSRQKNICLETTLSKQPSDIFLLACYPQFLPQRITSMPTIDCINIHPSILPRYRGSNPIFWQLRNGETATGVTLHQVTDEIDGGSILSTQTLEYPKGGEISRIEDLLVAAAVEQLQSLFCSNPADWKILEQNQLRATWQPPPCDMDFMIDSTLSAKTAWNFVRAYAKSEKTIKFTDQSRVYWIYDAIEHGKLGNSEATSSDDRTIRVNFIDGYVVFAIEKFEAIN